MDAPTDSLSSAHSGAPVEEAGGQRPYTLSATTLGRYFHTSCERQLHDSVTGKFRDTPSELSPFAAGTMELVSLMPFLAKEATVGATAHAWPMPGAAWCLRGRVAAAPLPGHCIDRTVHLAPWGGAKLPA